METLLLGVISFLLIEKWKAHPAFVIAGKLIYGGFFLKGEKAAVSAAFYSFGSGVTASCKS